MKRFIKIKGIKGLSLVEILVGISIVGILFVVFSSVFVNALKGINWAGERNEIDYRIQKAVENKINGNTIVLEDITTTEVVDTLSITFGSRTIIINGKIINVTYDNGEFDVSFKTFMPD